MKLDDKMDLASYLLKPVQRMGELDNMRYCCNDWWMNSFVKIMRINMKLDVNISHSQQSSEVRFKSVQSVKVRMWN